MIVRCPDCGRDVEPVPRIRGAKGWIGEARFCPTELAPLMRCEADLVGRGVMEAPAPPPKRKHELESTIQRRIVAYLEKRPDVFLWRHGTGAARFGDRRVSFGLVGSADLIGLQRGGRFVAIEVKTAVGRQSEHQAKYQRRIEALGGLYVLARSVDDVVRALGPP